MTIANNDIETTLDGIAENLASKFSATVSPATVRDVVNSSYRQLANGATVTNYLPLLTAREAEARLKHQRPLTATSP